jgi:hypothetical protein
MKTKSIINNYTTQKIEKKENSKNSVRREENTPEAVTSIPVTDNISMT